MHNWRIKEIFWSAGDSSTVAVQTPALSELNSPEDTGLPCSLWAVSVPVPLGGHCRVMHLLALGGFRGFCQALPGLAGRTGLAKDSASSVAPSNWELLLLCCTQGAPKPLPWHLCGWWLRSEVHITATVFQLLLPQTKTRTHKKHGKGFRVGGCGSFLKYNHCEFT